MSTSGIAKVEQVSRLPTMIVVAIAAACSFW
jgi:hypothetical protein